VWTASVDNLVAGDKIAEMGGGREMMMMETMDGVA